MASPLLGYNTNIRHKGQLYHVQTEDSGVKHPHVISHLYAEGGRIIATRKAGYAEHVDADNLQEIVRKLMQTQHKALCIELRDGVHDDGPAAAPEPAPPPATEQAPATRSAGAPRPKRMATVMLGPGMEADIPKPRVSRPPAAKRASRPPAAKRASRPPPAAKRASRPPAAAKRASRPPAAKRASRPPPAPDHDAFDRAAAARLAESPIGKAPPEARHKRAKPALEITLPGRRPTPRGKSLDQVILDYLAEDRLSKGK